MFARRLLLVVVAFCSPAATAQEQSLDPNQPYAGTKSNPVTYQVDLAAVVTPPFKCKLLRVWVPIPPTDGIQEVSDVRLTSFPMQVEPRMGVEKTYGNRFAYFEFHDPHGAQMVRHQFTVKTYEVRWHIDPAKVQTVAEWPATFEPFLRGERLVPRDERFAKVAHSIVPERSNPGLDLAKIITWVNDTMKYSHTDCSLQGSAIHALDKKMGHCSDYHGLCTALSRNLGYPTRIAYGINPTPKSSPSHCKLEAYLPPYGWVCFDVSETQQLVGKINQDESLDPVRKEKLTAAARARLLSGFRDNTWFVQTRGSDYDLAPPAKQKVALVRTIYAEADGIAYPEPDPANPEIRAHTWMTLHRYSADRRVSNPFHDWRSLESVSVP
jgi:transglutaminase-like putative cysteine protease